MNGRHWLALLALLPACSNEFGLSVVVSMHSDDWDSRWPIEHMRIEAVQGEDRAVGCLFPLTSVPPALAPEAADELACANAAQDLSVHPVDSNLSPLSWGLELGRRINFRFRSTETVTVRVHGNFGSRLAVFSASATGVPGEEYPQLDLRLEPERKPFLETAACPLQLDRVAGGVVCDQQDVACLFPADLANRRNTQAITEVRSACRVDNRLKTSGCGSKDLDQYVAVLDLFDTPNKQNVAQVEVKMRANFARCEDGSRDPNCRVSVACDRPRTEVLSIVRKVPLLAPASDSKQVQALQCMPATSTPIDYHFGVAAVPGEVSVGVLAQAPADDAAERCFFDVHDISFLAP
jgi:hypothetical protein